MFAIWSIQTKNADRKGYHQEELVLLLFCVLFAPRLVSGVTLTFNTIVAILKAFFIKDIIKTIIIAIVVAFVFGTISIKKEKAMIAFIGLLIEIIILWPVLMQNQ